MAKAVHVLAGADEKTCLGAVYPVHSGRHVPLSSRLIEHTPFWATRFVLAPDSFYRRLQIGGSHSLPTVDMCIIRRVMPLLIGQGSRKTGQSMWISIVLLQADKTRGNQLSTPRPPSIFCFCFLFFQSRR